MLTFKHAVAMLAKSGLVVMAPVLVIVLFIIWVLSHYANE